MKLPKKDKRKKQRHLIHEEVEDEIIPDYFIPHKSSLFIAGNYMAN